MKCLGLLLCTLATFSLSDGLKAIVVNARPSSDDEDNEYGPPVVKHDWKTLQKMLAPKLDSKPVGKVKTPSYAGRTVDIKTRSSRDADIMQFPWHAAITLDQSNFCSGSLVHLQWVLTTARCTKGFSNFSVTLGSDGIADFVNGRVTLESTVKYVHSLYSADTLNNNVGLIKLPLPITEKTASINLVRLPKVSEANKTFAGVIAFHSGFGADLNDSLTSANNKVISSTNCSLVFGTEFVTSTVLCLSNDKPTRCIGDNGGALVYKEPDGLWTQIGVHSFGSIASCMREEPSGFVRTSTHLGWISTISGRAIRP